MAKGDEVVHAVRKAPKKIIVKQKQQKPKNFKNGGKKFTKSVKSAGGGGFKQRNINAGGSLGSGIKTASAPAALGFAASSYMSMKSMGTGKYKGGIRVRGRDYFNQISIPPSTPAGTSLLNLPLNPTLLQGTRLAELAGLYEKYKFNKFSIVATPSTGSSTGGAYGMAYDRDPSDPTPSANLQGIRQYMAMPGAIECAHWMPAKLDCPLMEPVTDFFTNAIAGSDERLVDQGQFYLFELTPHTLSAALVMNLLIEYDLLLYVPCFDQEEVGVLIGKNVSGTTPTNMSSPSVAAKGGWNNMPLDNPVSVNVSGDQAMFARVTDGLGNLGVKVPAGLWELFQVFRQYGPVVTTGGVGQWTAPTFEATIPSEQSYFQVATVDLDITPMPVAVGLFKYPVSSTLNILVPPGGGTLFGNYATSTVTSGSSTQNEFSLGFFPGCGSITPDLELALVRPGKHGDVLRDAYRLKKLGLRPTGVSVPQKKEKVPRTLSLDEQAERVMTRLEEMRLLRIKRAYDNKAELAYRAKNAPKEKDPARVAGDDESDCESVDTDDLIREILGEQRLDEV
uniref:Capsid protein n=1 Tax=Picornavirales sp. TaxID=1955153 RepID=A0A514D6E4_9VIRU|nr:MAG: hypothetical protein H4Bulk4677_000001 [Picornavirales sp.]